MSRNNDTQHPAEAERGDEEQPFRLDHEIARKYDPTQLSKLIMRDAGRGEPLDAITRSQMERRIGGNFGGVRLVRGPLAEEVTSRYRADAVTVGGTELVLVRDGWRSNFQTTAGQALLAHELTHVQQQQRGLHFAHSHEEDTSSPLEIEALANEAAFKGGAMAQESESREALARKNVLDEVKKRVKKLMDKADKQDAARGSVNSQSRFG